MADYLSFTGKKRARKYAGKVKDVGMQNLIIVQKESYERFLQRSVGSSHRSDNGLENVFRSVFPIQDHDGRAVIEYVKYELGEPKYDVEECIQRDVDYAVPITATFRMIVKDIDEEAGTSDIKNIKEQEVYMGEIPLMTDRGTFIINGAERVVVSQMHRSPGVFYDHDNGKTHSSGKYLYSARVIPYRGSWLDFEFDVKDVLHFRIDRKRKMYVTTLLYALGLDRKQILDTFYKSVVYKKKKSSWVTKFDVSKFKGLKIYQDILDADTNEVIISAGSKVTPRVIQKFTDAQDRYYLVDVSNIIGMYSAEDVINPSTGEVLIEAGDEITQDFIDRVEDEKISEFKVLDIDYVNVGPYIRNALILDKNQCKEDALYEIYKVLRPGEPATADVAEALFNNTFFDSERYDLAAIGRMKINTKHNLKIPETHTVLTKEDIIAIVSHIISLKDGYGEVDDIDNLGNRRVRSVGELAENHFRLGLIRTERAVVERMGSVEIDTVMLHELINPKIWQAEKRAFFGTSQLSQFMDQTNPLSEVAHKRRLSALGPGGLTRERASFEVRDVHPTHYGRICPVETPEGHNIGLINSLAIYAIVDEYGFIQSPYKKVENCVVTSEVHYLSAIEESKYIIAQASAEVDENGKLVQEFVNCHKAGESLLARPQDISYIDLSPKQLVSVAASLIPFLENDDANRALMGSNMQRQAVPLLVADAPLVGTGMESVVAADSGATVIAKNDGVVVKVDANKIVLQNEDFGFGLNDSNSNESGVDIYTLTKFRKSNQNTCINQKPIVKVGDKVKRGDIIADGPSTDLGELALGKNIFVGFMPWNGCNFEDSMTISQRLVKEDVFTSIHIIEFEVVVRDTKLGPEEITRDIPNAGTSSSLDEVGIVYVGAEVNPGDILVGKVTPKSESPVTPEEKLLRAIFGEKALDVRDTSLRLPPGVSGTVVEVRTFSRRGVEKDERSLSLERHEIDILIKDRDTELSIIENYVFNKLKDLFLNHVATSAPKSLKVGSVITAEVFDSIPKRQIWHVAVEDAMIMDAVSNIKAFYDKAVADLEKHFKRKVEKIQSGDDLPQGALKVVKVYVATKQKIQPGDKMAGRHGNKGVVSKIVPEEDMPFLEDGTPLDIVLNPLGVPSRMNVGQILETHLGWAAKNLGKQIDEALRIAREKEDVKQLKEKLLQIYDGKNEKDFRDYLVSISEEELFELSTNLSKGVPFSTPVFDGANEAYIEEQLRRAGLPTAGQVTLYDGKTGEPFERKVTVGYMYMLKLDHLVDDKIHSRSIGPYSLVTQQPLGGKSHFGGQRFGEMECWALQAYGAAYTLQEMLTVKSDDITGRIKMYESIVRGDSSFESGMPESFNVMLKELRSLCLNVEMQNSDDESVEEAV